LFADEVLKQKAMNRKEFLKTSVLAIVGVALGPAFLESCQKATTGPPPNPVKKYTITRNSNILTIKG